MGSVQVDAENGASREIEAEPRGDLREVPKSQRLFARKAACRKEAQPQEDLSSVSEGERLFARKAASRETQQAVRNSKPQKQ
jgi:anti-sigma-K factor RskA